MKPFNPGDKVDSATWLAKGRLLFGRMVPVRPAHNGVDWDLVREPLRDFEFYCASCGQSFTQITTPTECPKCGLPPRPDQAVEVAHKGYVGLTFPFAIG